MSFNLFKEALSAYAARKGNTLNEDKLKQDCDEVDIRKSHDIEQQISVEIIAEPNTPDAHGEYYSEETIQKGFESADKALKDGRLNMNLYHIYDDEGANFVELVKHYIVPFDCTVNDQLVKSGTWIGEVKWHSDELWHKRIDVQEDGSTEIAGLSLFGWGNREVKEDAGS